LYCIYAVSRPEIRKEISVASFDVDTITFWNDLLSAFGDTVIPVMVSVIGAVAANPAETTGNDIFDAISCADLLTGEDASAVLVNTAFDDVVNTSDGNVILTVSPLANACEIFIVILKVPVVHTAELP
jgi:hypothetical protein